MHDLTGVCTKYTANNWQQNARDARDYFWRVIHAYNETRLLPCITAINPDPISQSHRLDVYCIHYICDVELASRRALDNNLELLDQWARLTDGENVANATSIIRRCASVYERRKLAPSTYFRTIKEGRRDRRPCIQGAA